MPEIYAKTATGWTEDTSPDLASDMVATADVSAGAMKRVKPWRLSRGVKGADIASAATLNLDNATGDIVDVTGTTGITAITLAEGRRQTVRFTGILTITNGASLVNLTGANITTAAGDFAVFRGYASGVVRMTHYSRASGAALVTGVGGSTGATDNNILRADGTGGATVQSSNITLSDGNTFTSPDYMAFSNGGGGYNTAFNHGAYIVAYLLANRFNIYALALNSDTPAQITANQNDYSIVYSSVLHRLSSDASRNITGMVQNLSAANGGDLKILLNVGANDIVLTHQDALSAAANRFLCSTGANITLSANQAALCWYDSTTGRWRVFKFN